jgi:alpha-glucosidase (family GH31 glycosyl hydrolase)
LDNKTISLNSTHSYGNDKIAELYVHNGNAHLQLKKTWNAWLATNDSTTKRPLLFTEASWAGSGAFSVGLVTNLYRNWDSLRYLIDHALGLSISGMSNLMIDAC